MRNPLEIVDNRTPVQLVAEGDHRWPAGFAAGAPTEDPPFTGKVYIPRRLKGEDKRRELREFVRQLLRLEAVLMPGAELIRLRRDFVRTSGDMACPQCGQAYRDHPHDVDDEPDVSSGSGLVILCDRTRVHL
jgi:hypothetical protein